MTTVRKTTACTVDLEVLQPGDVLLTTQRSINSWVIRKATSSQYSHAILYVGEGLIIESGPKEGIAFGLLDLVKAESDHQRREYRLLACVKDASVTHVYRHSRLAERTPSAEQKLNSMCELNSVLPEKWGRDYSMLESLGMATPLLRRLPQLKRAILRTAGRLGADNGKVVPSDFCSELVANALTDFGFPPFKESRPGEIPSPQWFADLEFSNMVRIEAAERHPDQAKEGDTERLTMKLQTQKMHFSTQLNQYRKSQLHVQAALDELNSAVMSQMQAMQGRIDKIRNSTGK